MKRFKYNASSIFNDYQTPSNNQFYLVSMACILNIVFFCFLIISLCSCSLTIQTIDVQKTGDIADTITQKVEDHINE
jgi:hypothetical protein